VTDDIEAKLDSKTGRPIREVVAGFKFQPAINNCYPNGIHNILKELSDRHGVGINLSERKVNTLTGYKELLGPKPEAVVPSMNRALKPHGYTCKEQSSASYQDLLDVLVGARCSYPLLEVSHEYFVEVAPRYRFKGSPLDHVLIGLKVDAEEVIVWDSYHHYLGSSARMEGMVGLVRLSTGRFLELWEKAEEPSWMFWIFRERTQTTKLMDFER
jgi:hypothetical protein